MPISTTFARIAIAPLAIALLTAVLSSAHAETSTTNDEDVVDIDRALAELDRDERAELTDADDLYDVPDVYDPSYTLDEMSPALVSAVQRALEARGYQVLTADGVVGPPTRMALNAYLARRGWTSGHELSREALAELGVHLSKETP